jgi:Domain of unknown function (DUF4397)
MRLTRFLAIGAAASLPLLAMTVPATAADEATVSVLHAIPAGSGADVVDVYAGSTLLIDNFTPGTLKTMQVPAGSYDLGVYADGQAPGSGTPLLEAKATAVPAGANATVTANLDGTGAPALNVFVNDTSPVPAGQGRLTVRHIAAAPAVDVRANGTVAFGGLTNPNEAKANIPAGTISADVVLAGTTTVAIGPADVPVKEGANTIVYAWGSAEGSTLALATQTVEAHMDSAPTGVPAGDGSLADQQSAGAGWALGLGALALIGAAAVARKVTTS